MFEQLTIYIETVTRGNGGGLLKLINQLKNVDKMTKNLKSKFLSMFGVIGKGAALIQKGFSFVSNVLQDSAVDLLRFVNESDKLKDVAKNIEKIPEKFQALSITLRANAMALVKTFQNEVTTGVVESSGTMSKALAGVGHTIDAVKNFISDAFEFVLTLNIRVEKAINNFVAGVQKTVLEAQDGFNNLMLDVPFISDKKKAELLERQLMLLEKIRDVESRRDGANAVLDQEAEDRLKFFDRAREKIKQNLKAELAAIKKTKDKLTDKQKAALKLAKEMRRANTVSVSEEDQDKFILSFDIDSVNEKEAFQLLENLEQRTISALQRFKNRFKEAAERAAESSREAIQMMVDKIAGAAQSVASVVSGFDSIAQVEKDITIDRLSEQRTALDAEKDILQSRLANAQNINRQEVASYRHRLAGIAAAQAQLDQQQAAAERKAARSAKRAIVLQGIAAVAASYAAATKAMVSQSNPISMGSAFASVLATGLGAVAQIKAACAKVKGGGGGGIGGAGGGGGASGGGGGGNAPTINPNQFPGQLPDAQRGPRRSINVTLVGRGVYDADTVVELVELINDDDTVRIKADRIEQF